MISFICGILKKVIKCNKAGAELINTENKEVSEGREYREERGEGD